MPKVGYVALIGRPNAGKSTLLNALIGEKVSAVSSRPQTTQRSIPGILTDEDKKVQMIFLDTPGIHEGFEGREDKKTESSRSINERINAEAFASLRQADVIIRLYDPTRPRGSEDERIDRVLSFVDTPIIAVETKQDLLVDGAQKTPSPDGAILINALKHEGLDTLKDAIMEHLPEGPYLYESDYYTIQTMEFRIQEAIREQLFLELGEEIPYASYVEVDHIENTDTLMKIHAYVHVESESQKIIMIGKGGKKIQTIGTGARHLLEGIFGKKVFLILRVKVHKNWRKDPRILERLFPKK